MRDFTVFGSPTVNSEKNAALLEKVPHKDMEDIAIVYRVLLGQMDDGIASVVVTNEMLEKMDITKENLLTIIHTSPARRTFRVISRDTWLQ